MSRASAVPTPFRCNFYLIFAEHIHRLSDSLLTHFYDKVAALLKLELKTANIYEKSGILHANKNLCVKRQALTFH